MFGPKSLWNGILAAFLICNATAHASSPKQSHPLTAIDALQIKLAHEFSSKSAKTIGEALKLIQSKNFSAARKLSLKLDSNELFSDYASFIRARAWEAEAGEQIRNLKFNAAAESGKHVLNELLQIQVRQPYSPLINKIPKDLARAEIRIAEAYYGAKNWLQVIHYFEFAFQRLSSAKSLSLVYPESLDKYVYACMKKGNGYCIGWLQKLKTVWVKNSPENKIINKFPSEKLERDSPANTPKLNQSYRQADLDQLAFDEALSLYLDGKYSRSAESFELLLKDFPKSVHRNRAKYWLALSHARNKKNELAQQNFQELIDEVPLTWHGLLASVGLGKPITETIDQVIPQAKAFDSYLTPAESIRLDRAQKLLAEKLLPEAALELREITVKESYSTPFLVYLTFLNALAGNHSGSFSSLTQLIQRQADAAYTKWAIQLIFPLQNWDLIQKISKLNNLDPILVISLIKQESAFQTDALSSTGASGLMQLMPATAIDTDPTIKRAELVFAEPNLKVGTKYLKSLLNRFQGNIALSLAAYNAGPAAVDRWVKSKGANSGMLEFIEQIPYKETREYVGSIIRNYYWYCERLKCDSPKSLSFFWTAPPLGGPTSPQSSSTPTPEQLEEKLDE